MSWITTYKIKPYMSADETKAMLSVEDAVPHIFGTEFPLGVYDVTFADGKVDSTEGMGLSQLDVVEGEFVADYSERP